MTKTKANESSRLSGGDFFIAHRAYTAGRFKKGNYTKVKPCFFTKSVRCGRAKLSFLFAEPSSRDLHFGHGFRALSFKNKRNKLDFHTSGGFKEPKTKKSNLDFHTGVKLDFHTFGGSNNEKRKRNKLMKSVKCWSLEL